MNTTNKTLPPCILNQAGVAGMFDTINALFFQGFLSEPLWDIGMKDDVLDYGEDDTVEGYCCNDGEHDIIALRADYPSIEVFEVTLIHEMIHLAQMQLHGETPNHGASFKTMHDFIFRAVGKDVG